MCRQCVADVMYGHKKNTPIDDADSTVFVCPGRRVQVAMRANLSVPDAWYNWYRPTRAHDGAKIDVVTIPHPSSLNRLLNDPTQRSMCSQTLQEAMRA